jgi:hypothetical protein
MEWWSKVASKTSHIWRAEKIDEWRGNILMAGISPDY